MSLIKKAIFAFSFIPLLWVVCCSDSGLRAQTIYVSSSIGSDLNSGEDITQPLRTIRKALRNGNIIRLKAGDVFYETNDFSNVTIEKYGEGTNPVICGFFKPLDAQWKETSENIWRIDLGKANFEGYPVNQDALDLNIGCFYDNKEGIVHGNRKQKQSDLRANWDFWQTEKHSKDVKAKDFEVIYLYLDHNPNQLDLSLTSGASAGHIYHSTIQNVNFIGFGFGLGCRSGTVIKNCKLDVLGGRLILGSSEFICYGNGIEFYVSSDIEDCLVVDCFISRCYDCGITIQGQKSGRATPRNITIRKNLITNCCQGWEDFLRNDEDVVYENCVFSNNIVMKSGNTTGFGYDSQRFKYCHVLGNNVKGDRGMRIEENVFIDGNFYCSGIYNGGYRSNKWKDNKCYLTEGEFILGEYMGRRDVLRAGISKRASRDQIQTYRILTGDETTEFYVESRKRIKRRVAKLQKQFLKTHTF